MSKYKIEFKWAVIFTIMMLFWMVMERAFGFHDDRIEQHATITNFVAIPAILMYVLALLDKRKNYYNGFMTYSQAFVSGLIMSIIITLLSPLSQYITVEFITPNYFENMIAYTMEQGLMTEEAARLYFNLKSYLVQTIIATPIMGIVTTAIVAIFVRKAPKTN